MRIGQSFFFFDPNSTAIARINRKSIYDHRNDVGPNTLEDLDINKDANWDVFVGIGHSDSGLKLQYAGEHDYFKINTEEPVVSQ